MAQRSFGTDIEVRTDGRSVTNNNEDNEGSSRHPSRRSYKFVNRFSKPKRHSSAMRTAWMNRATELLSKTDDQISSLLCCKSVRCFSVVDKGHLRENILRLVEAPNNVRRSFLGSLYRPQNGGSFKYDGTFVCSTFLLEAFKFSRDLQSSVKKCKLASYRSRDSAGPSEATRRQTRSSVGDDSAGQSVHTREATSSIDGNESAGPPPKKSRATRSSFGNESGWSSENTGRAAPSRVGHVHAEAQCSSVENLYKTDQDALSGHGIDCTAPSDQEAESEDMTQGLHTAARPQVQTQSAGPDPSSDMLPITYALQSGDIASSIPTMDYHKEVIDEGEQDDSTSRSNSIDDSIRDSYSQSDIVADTVITHLDILSKKTGSNMPNNSEIHLPHFCKKQVYESYCQNFSRIYPGENCASESYFYRIWKKHRSLIKVRKVPKFTKCSECERFRTALQKAATDGTDTKLLLAQRDAHVTFVAEERRYYRMKTEMAKGDPGDYLSLAIDGADQKNYTLPHFSTHTKDERGHGLAVHLVGVLIHASISQLRLFTMTDEHATGSNHIVEAIHRVVDEISKCGRLPRTLFLQLDNCTRENKNKFLMAYIEFLVHKKAFDTVEVGFLPVGHTHTDIDQAFSTTSRRLRTHDAITLSDMHGQLSKCYNDRTMVTRMQNCINWSGLCEKTNCIYRISNITQYRFFKFNRVPVTDSRQHKVICMVKSTKSDTWINMTNGLQRDKSCFLSRLPDLRQTPPESVKEPVDFNEVTARIMSEDSRIQNPDKFRDLLALRDEVYQDRSLNFHWDLASSVECGGADRTDEDYLNTEMCENVTNKALPASLSGPPRSNYDYALSSFVAVRQTDSDERFGFWIGRIVDVYNGTEQIIHELSVHWYDFYSGSDPYVGKYRSLYLPNSSTAKRSTSKPWVDRISVDSVLVSFDNLTSDRTLPTQVSRYLRETVRPPSSK